LESGDSFIRGNRHFIMITEVLSGLGQSGMFGASGLGSMMGSQEAPAVSSATSGGPFTSGSVTVGKGGIDTQTIMIIGAVALVALFLLKR